MTTIYSHIDKTYVSSMLTNAKNVMRFNFKNTVKQLTRKFWQFTSLMFHSWRNLGIIDRGCRLFRRRRWKRHFCFWIGHGSAFHNRRQNSWLSCDFASFRSSSWPPEGWWKSWRFPDWPETTRCQSLLWCCPTSLAETVTKSSKVTCNSSFEWCHLQLAILIKRMESSQFEPSCLQLNSKTRRFDSVHEHVFCRLVTAEEDIDS